MMSSYGFHVPVLRKAFCFSFSLYLFADKTMRFCSDVVNEQTILNLKETRCFNQKKPNLYLSSFLKYRKTEREKEN